MKKSIDNKKDFFNQNLLEYANMQKEDNDLDNRLLEAQENIVNLQGEKEKLKQQRPAMLADKADISELNKRLKEIDDEIEINSDTVTGITAKRKTLKHSIYHKLCDTQSAYKSYIQSILDEEVADKFIKAGKKLAEIAKEYITLEEMRNGNESSRKTLGYDFEIPNIHDSKNPILPQNKQYDIARNLCDEIEKKYDIPHFNVRYIRCKDYE